MHDWVREAAARHGDRQALKVAPGRVWTWHELALKVDGLAGQLRTVGVDAGSRVVWIGSSAEHGVSLLFALARLTAVFVPLNVRLTARELRVQTEWAGANVVLCARNTEAQAARLADLCPVYSLDPPEYPGVRRLPEPSGVVQPSVAESTQSVQSVMFTSGTTGTPKGAQITFGNQLASARASALRTGASAQDLWLLTLPLYHIGGMTIPIRAALSGACVVEYETGTGFDATRLARIVEVERITHVSLVPTMLHRLLEMGFAGTPDLQVILLGGAAAPVELLERAWGRGLPVAPTYGLTEACSQVATMAANDAIRKPGCVGRPLDGTTVTILHDDGTEAAVGEVGEIVVRGPTVFAGYLNAANDSALRDGALYTGDMGYLDEDGALSVVQRRTDLIVTGGENVYPAEVEAILRAHPSVADACVVGLAHPDWGQQVAAAVVIKPESELDLAALDVWCRERLAGYKRPRRFLIVPELPMTASGKVMRRSVVAMFSE